MAIALSGIISEDDRKEKQQKPYFYSTFINPLKNSAMIIQVITDKLRETVKMR